MRISIILFLFFAFTLLSCGDKAESALTTFEVYCEMVSNDAKPLALSQPMGSELLDGQWKEFQKIAGEYNVLLFREDNFPISALFPAGTTEKKSVVLIYKGNRLKQYEQWKVDIESTERSDTQQQEALARRFGRLLGYSPQGINQLLSKNSAFRSLSSFGVEQQITHLYYDNVKTAIDFYKNVIGFNEVDSALFQISQDAFIKLNLINEDHPVGQPKSTAIAFLTDQLPEWYTHLQKQNVAIKYTYKPREGGPHDGFVALDPGGYLLEFEQFKQHPENELFIAVLAEAPRIKTSNNTLNFYGSITWTYHKDMLKMQKFYEEVLGYQMVADQGWTKIYQTSSTGFIGLVDERRGMENYAETKAVEIEWKVSKKDEFDNYGEKYWKVFNYSEGTFIGPEKYKYTIN